MHAPVVWAQRKDQIFLSIDLQDVKDSKIDLQESKLVFHGVSAGKKYFAEINFSHDIDPAVC